RQSPMSLRPGQPLVLFARVLGGSPDAVRLVGRAAGRPYARTLPTVTAPADTARILPVLWAAGAVRALSPDQDAMRARALRYGVLCPQTALVAVDATKGER